MSPGARQRSKPSPHKVGSGARVQATVDAKQFQSSQAFDGWRGRRWVLFLGMSTIRGVMLLSWCASKNSRS
jgi:hypothetical protein